MKKIYPVCFLYKTKGWGYFFFFKIKQLILWSSIIIGQSYFEEFDVISTSLKETKGKVRGKGKGSFDKSCQPLGPESEASCFYHVAENSGKKFIAINDIHSSVISQLPAIIP